MNKKRLLFLLFIILLCLFEVSGCKNKNKSSDEVISDLKNLKSYESKVDMYVKNDKQELKYEMKQYCDSTMGYRLEIGEDRVQIYKDNLIYVTDKKNNSKYELQNGFDELYKVSFIGEYIKLLYTNDDIKYNIENIEGNIYQLVETILPGNNKSLSKAVMYIDIDKAEPVKIIIYDDKDKARVTIIYREFKPNTTINKELFKVDKAYSKNN